jgi:hypothetical protein
MLIACSLHNDSVLIDELTNAPTYPICKCGKRAHRECYDNLRGDEENAAKPTCSTCGEQYSMRIRVLNRSLCPAVRCRDLARMFAAALFAILHSPLNLFLMIGFSYDAKSIEKFAMIMPAIGPILALIHFIVVAIYWSGSINISTAYDYYRSRHPALFARIDHAAKTLPINHYLYNIAYSYTLFGVSAQIFGAAILYMITGIPMMNIMTYAAGHMVYAAVVIVAAAVYCVKNIALCMYYEVCTVEQRV